MRANLTAITIQESKRLIELEKVIKRGSQTFVDVGNALAEIRDLKLFKSEFKTFEEYCRSKWGWNRHRASQLITAADIVGSIPELVTIVTKEGQARELAKVVPEKRTEVAEAAKAKADSEDRPMTAKDISEAADESTPKTPAERNEDSFESAMGGKDAIKAALAKHQADTVHAFKVAVGKLIADLPKNIDTFEIIEWLHGQANLLSNRRDQQKHMKAYTA